MKYIEHVDTLYLTFEDQKGRKDLYQQRVSEIVDFDMPCIFSNAIETKYRFDDFDILVKDFDYCEKSKNHHFTLFYHWNFLISWDMNFVSLPLPFSNGLVGCWRIKRLDYNITFQSDDYQFNFNDFCDNIHVKGLSKFGIIGSSNSIETKTFGTRKSGKFYRIYDKTKEMKDKQQFLKEEYFKKFFKISSFATPLISIEIELTNTFLMKKFENTNLYNLSQILSFGKAQLLGIYIDKDMLSTYMGYVDNIKKNVKYEPSLKYLAKTVEGLIQAYRENSKKDISLDTVFSAIAMYQRDTTEFIIEKS